MDSIEWHEVNTDGTVWWRAHGLPLWKDGQYPEGIAWVMWIDARPSYCDRGRYLLHVAAPIDGADGFPRYYSSLDVAKSEALEWVKIRSELK